MDIRKHIIILCLLCCHAICVMADGQIVREYKPISVQDAKGLLEFNPLNNKVIGVSYGDYKIVGDSYKRLFASSKTSKNHSFALKVGCNNSGHLTFRIQEVEVAQTSIRYRPTYEHTVIVDGRPTVVSKEQGVYMSQKVKCELTAGEHEIVIMSNYEGSSEEPRSIQITLDKLHSHIIRTKDQRLAICGQDGYIRRECKWCDSHWTDTLPMPAKVHRYDRSFTWQGSCTEIRSMLRTCVLCGVSYYKKRKGTSQKHNFQNGRCVNEGCRIKLPAQNAAGIYQVGDAYELRGLAEQIASGYIPRDCNIDLTADITYPGNLEHIPIGTTDYPFAGTFDGHGHRISKMQTTQVADIIGLFGMVKGTPRRLAVIANVIIDANSKLKGRHMVGAIAGRADYCDIMRCVNRATILGNSNVGGIVGYSERDCHVIDCAGLGIIDSKENSGLLSGTLRQGYIMDSYGSGSFANGEVAPALVPTADSYLRHCFQLDAKAPATGVTSFSSAQMSDGTLARMLCEKNGKGMPAHWQQGATDAYPMPVFTALTDRPASVIQPRTAEAVMSAYSVNSYSEEEGEEDYDDFDEEEEDEWELSTSEVGPTEECLDEDVLFYDEADSTLYDFTCYVSTTFRNVPAMPMFAAMEGGDATECDVTYCKSDSSIVMEYNYTIDGSRYILTDATKQYMMPDSAVHVECYEVEINEDEHDGEFLMTSHTVYYPDNSGYEEKVSHGVATRVMDWEISLDEGSEQMLNYYFYDEYGQERVEVYSIPSSKRADEDDEILLPVDMDYTLDENGRLIDLHYLLTDSLTGEQYNIGGEYYIYDEQGELIQAVSYEPVAPHSHEMRQTEYTTFQTIKHEEDPTSIIPIEHLQPNTLAGAPTRTSSHVYDLRGNLVRLNNDPATLKSLPKGIYITRGRKFLVH